MKKVSPSPINRTRNVSCAYVRVYASPVKRKDVSTVLPVGTRTAVKKALYTKAERTHRVLEVCIGDTVIERAYYTNGKHKPLATKEVIELIDDIRFPMYHQKKRNKLVVLNNEGRKQNALYTVRPGRNARRSIMRCVVKNGTGGGYVSKKPGNLVVAIPKYTKALRDDAIPALVAELSTHSVEDPMDLVMTMLRSVTKVTVKYSLGNFEQPVQEEAVLLLSALWMIAGKGHAVREETAYENVNRLYRKKGLAQLTEVSYNELIKALTELRCIEFRAIGEKDTVIQLKEKVAVTFEQMAESGRPNVRLNF